MHQREVLRFLSPGDQPQYLKPPGVRGGSYNTSGRQYSAGRAYLLRPERRSSPGGSYSAGIACNLYGKVTPTYSHPMAMMGRHPYITQDGPDYSPESGGQPPRSYIANGKDGLVAGFKYFDLTGAGKITVVLRGPARGRLFVRTDPKGGNLAEIAVTPSGDWKPYTVPLSPCEGVHPLYLCYAGRGKLDILEFSF